MLGTVVPYGAQNLSAAAFGTCEEERSMGILSVHSMWLLPTFFWLAADRIATFHISRNNVGI